MSPNNTSEKVSLDTNNNNNPKGTAMNINELAEQVTEEQALDLYYKFTKRFGWAGELFVREDANSAWHADNYEDDDPVAISDAEWNAVKASKSWSRFGEYLSEDSYELVRDAIKEAKAAVKASQIYTVWVGGVEVNDELVDYDDAVFFALTYDAQGHDDVQLVNTKDNIVIAKHEWVNA